MFHSSSEEGDCVEPHVVLQVVDNYAELLNHYVAVEVEGAQIGRWNPLLRRVVERAARVDGRTNALAVDAPPAPAFPRHHQVAPFEVAAAAELERDGGRRDGVALRAAVDRAPVDGRRLRQRPREYLLDVLHGVLLRRHRPVGGPAAAEVALDLGDAEAEALRVRRIVEEHHELEECIVLLLQPRWDLEVVEASIGIKRQGAELGQDELEARGGHVEEERSGGVLLEALVPTPAEHLREQGVAHLAQRRPPCLEDRAPGVDPHKVFRGLRHSLKHALLSLESLVLTLDERSLIFQLEA
mmetsp:Transcript_36002/g.99831  ORF Transcript_36002/g.99831 Transcript_36002/m.99831 type:complete len:298 (+) Transcript_36002:189-1082(+)